jgi:hypothetical protein
MPVLVMLPLAVSAIRNVGPFLMVAAPAMTIPLPLPRRSARENGRSSTRRSSASPQAVAVTLAGLREPDSEAAL